MPKQPHQRHLFQSTPANFTAGDPAVLVRQGPDIEFQSTPANFTAGDGVQQWRCVHHLRFNPRPPISQRATRGLITDGVRMTSFQSTPANFTAGDAVASRGRRDPCRFNPRPPISQRATTSSRRWRGCHRSFNPRPPISQRATDQALDLTGITAVSIHARQFHSGRPG